MRINNVLTKSSLINNQFRRYVTNTEKPKDITSNVKGLSSKVITANPPPERVKKAAVNGPYKNPQYFSYHKTSYFDAEIEMLQILLRYVPMITFPIAFVAGIIGYNFERNVRNVETPSIPSVLEAKLKRKKDDTNIFHEETPVLERNLSPPLKKHE